MVRPKLSPKTAVPRGVTIHICLFYAVSDTEFLYFYAFGNTGDSSMQISELLYFHEFSIFFFFFNLSNLYKRCPQCRQCPHILFLFDLQCVI